MTLFRIESGDCRDVMLDLILEGVQVDAIVTDPPYHLSTVKRFGKAGAAPAKSNGPSGVYKRASAGFMGQAWDGGDIAFDPETWALCLKLLKPGGHLLAFSGSRTYHRMACAIEDAGFEIRDQIGWAYGCLSDDTECLTRRGWVSYTALSEDDEVLQWDSSSGQLSWTRPEAVHEYDFDGELIHLRNRNTSQLLTPNHRVYAKVKRHSRHPEPTKYEVLDAEAVDSRSSAWQVSLPLAGVLEEGLPVDADYAYLVGWWLTDAWVHGDGKACMFSQSKPETLAKLRAALRPYNPSEYTKPTRSTRHQMEHTFYLTGPIADRLIGRFPDRRLPWDVLSWSLEARRSLFEGLMDGDGSRQDVLNGRPSYSQTFWSLDQERRDVFMALALSLGYRVIEDRKKGAVYLNVRRDSTQFQHKHRSDRVPYKGKVWCLTVPTGAFVVRRDGKPFITGNSGFPKSHDVSKGIDKSLGAEGGVIPAGEPVKRMIPGADQHKTGSGIKDNGRVYQPGQYVPATPEAAQWEGWGTALKPAWEPIVVARKPLSEKSVAANVLEHGTGALNIDGCRVPLGSGEKPFAYPNGRGGEGWHGRESLGANLDVPVYGNEAGRWPANLIHDGSDEVLALFPDSKGQLAKASSNPDSPRTRKVYGKLNRADNPMSPRGDSGSAARFFYCAKASRADRAGSKHPTVKPIDLMRYLCRLVTPPGGTVLDPFAGSGTTGQAAVEEGFRAVLIEREAEYIADIERRMESLLEDALS